jgi:hypothetical protein
MERLFSLIVLLAYVAAILAASFTLYSILYWMVIPETLFARPLLFEHQASERRATVPLVRLAHTDENDLWPVSAPFDLRLELVMAESKTNIAAGVFMVTVELIGANGTVGESVARSCFLGYRNRLHRFIRTVLFALPMLLGMFEESQLVSLPLLAKYVEKAQLVAARVIIPSVVQIYSATLMIEVHLTGLRYAIRVFWLPAALHGVSLLAVSLVACTHCVLGGISRGAPALRRTGRRRHHTTHSIPLRSKRAA